MIDSHIVGIYKRALRRTLIPLSKKMLSNWDIEGWDADNLDTEVYGSSTLWADWVWAIPIPGKANSCIPNMQAWTTVFNQLFFHFTGAPSS